MKKSWLPKEYWVIFSWCTCASFYWTLVESFLQCCCIVICSWSCFVVEVSGSSSCCTWVTITIECLNNKYVHRYFLKNLLDRPSTSSYGHYITLGYCSAFFHSLSLFLGLSLPLSFWFPSWFCLLVYRFRSETLSMANIRVVLSLLSV